MLRAATPSRNYVHRTEIEYGDDWFAMTGFQLLSSALVKMTCRFRRDGKPAKFVFGEREIEATVSNVAWDEERGLTSVTDGTVTVRQVEHILSALYGMNALDTDIELKFVEGSETGRTVAPPIAHLDAKDFTLAIRRCFPDRGRAHSGALSLDQAYIFREEDASRDGSVAVFGPLDETRISVHINFSNFLGQQVASCSINPIEYEREVCWARSFFSTPFPHKSEWKDLRKRYPGLIRDRGNHYRSIMIDYNSKKWLTPLHAPDEPVRHKMLDFIGDLALLGAYLDASVYVYKPHHRFNRSCVRRLLEAIGG